MLKNYLRSAIQFLRKNKLFTAINILGLSLALSVSFIISLYVINALSYNHCHDNINEIFRVVNYNVEFKHTKARTPYVLASTLKQDFPQVEKVIQSRQIYDFRIKLNDEYIDIDHAVGTGSAIFDIFTIPLIQQSETKGLLDDKNSIIICESLARKIFFDQDAVGQSIEVTIANHSKVFIVKGVYRDLEKNSTFQAQCLVNSEWTIHEVNGNYKVDNADANWKIDGWITWVLLNDSKDVRLINEQLKTSMRKYFDDSNTDVYSLQHLSDIYFNKAGIINSGKSGNLKNIKLFSTIASIIILLAALNYILLSSTVSSSRAKEIGIRKSIGANSRSIQIQLFAESIMLAFIALPISLIMVYLAYPFAGELFDTELSIISNNLLIYIGFFFGITLLIGFASGIYSALFLSKLQVVNILKSKLHLRKRKLDLKAVLIVAELIIFCCFISSLLIIKSQHQFFLSKAPGYKTENILFLNVGWKFPHHAAFMNDVSSNPYVINVAGSVHTLPMKNKMTIMVSHYQEKDKKVVLELMAVDYNFLKTMRIQKIKGRYFNKNEQYSSNQQPVILNEAAVKKLGLINPLGQKTDENFIIVGVVKDFNLHELYSDIPPLFICIAPPEHLSQIAINYQEGHFNDVKVFLQEQWKKYDSEKDLEVSTIERITEELYIEEDNLSRIVTYASLFALLISMFGLLGLTLFIAKARTKEIGIKKVLGSSEYSIIGSFVIQNMLAVLIAGVIATPITWYFMQQWLSNYAYHIDVSIWYFLITLCIAAFTVLLTVGINSYKAATRNPVEALRYE
jgi:putative ABC transport system permease protein